MNREKLKVLADAIENADEQTFDMSAWFTPASGEESMVWSDTFVAGGINAHCGTAGCIAGWACNIFLPPGEEVAEDLVERKAMELLEVDGYDTAEWHDMDRLFSDSDFWGVDDLSSITKEMAVTELRRIANEVPS